MGGRLPWRAVVSFLPIDALCLPQGLALTHPATRTYGRVVLIGHTITVVIHAIAAAIIGGLWSWSTVIAESAVHAGDGPCRQARPLSTG